VANIDQESLRMQQLIERLLHLAQVEQRQGLEEQVEIALRALVESLLDAQMARMENAGIWVENMIDVSALVLGERFLLRQALANVLDNALDFTPTGGLLRFTVETQDKHVALRVFNQGPAIPDYALGRLSERFYSLPRPGTGRKSTGLGLNFVAEVMQLHSGRLQVENTDGGVLVCLMLPKA
jgi:two-component system sensor histidine kinase CreC